MSPARACPRPTPCYPWQSDVRLPAACRVLLWRELLAVTRNPADVAGRMLIFCWVSAFIGLIFWDLALDVTGLRNRCWGGGAGRAGLQPGCHLLLLWPHNMD
jgi:hypothetical protein